MRLPLNQNSSQTMSHGGGSSVRVGVLPGITIQTASRGSPSVSSPDSELCDRAHEHQPAEGIVQLREGVPVAEDRRVRKNAGNDGRILVEDIVDSGAQEEVLVDVPRQGEVEVVPGSQFAVGRVRGCVEQWIRARRLVRDLVDMTPGHGHLDVPRGGPGRANLVTPCRERALGLAALRTKKARAVELARALDRLEFPLVEPGPQEVERESAGGIHRDGVIEPEVDPVRIVSAEVLVERDYFARRQRPQGAERIAPYQVAGRAGIQTRRQQGRGGRVADDIVHLDHPPVDGSGEIPDRREYETQGVAVRCFGLQVRVAPLQEVVLAGRAEKNISAVLGGRYSAQGALGGRGRWRAATGRGTTGILSHAEEVIPLGLEQLLDVRVTHRALVAAAEAVLPDRRPFRAEPVG